MRFGYISFQLTEPLPFFGTSIARPIVPVEIIVGDVTIGYAALIDSGADFCIFDGSIGELLGIDVQSGEVVPFGGVQAGAPSRAYLHEVFISIGSSRHAIRAGFSYDIAPHGYGLLGQKGFFDLFTVEFDLQAEEIEIKENE